MIKLKKISGMVEGFDTYLVNRIPTAQKWGTHHAFKELANKDISRVVEIGTWKGGLSLLLKLCFPKSRIFTFDINQYAINPYVEELAKNDIKFFHKDVFESKDMINLIQNDGRVLVLCDGGHKMNELTFFAPMLKRGDLIGAHDYSEHGKAEHWVTSEIDGTMINKFCEDRNIKEIMADVFHHVAWTIREKC
jgi:hypothetical protein